MAPAHSSTVLKPTRSVLALAVALVLAFAALAHACVQLPPLLAPRVEGRPQLWSPLLVVRVVGEPVLAVVGLLPELSEPSPSISSGAIALCVFQRKKPKRLQMNTDSCW